MHRVALSAIPEVEQRSPGGKFHSYCRNISMALGAPRNTGLWGGGHPFDVQIRRIPSGAAVCPYHLHLAQWELFVVRAGEGTVRCDGERHAIKAGDAFFHPPGSAHQLINTGAGDLEVLILADNPPLDAFFYPDSNKWGLRPPGNYFRMAECDYFTGEDEANETAGGYRPAPSAPSPPIAPFARRHLALDSLPWQNFDSPKRKFRSDSKAITEALGGLPNQPTGLGGHPFDLELGRLPAGYSNCPYHSHATQWEFYLFVSGTATVRTKEGETILHGGEVVLHPPGETHQFTNTGTDDLLYFLITDNPPVDLWHYPDSGKWGFTTPRKHFRATDADYWDGEE